MDNQIDQLAARLSQLPEELLGNTVGEARWLHERGVVVRDEAELAKEQYREEARKLDERWKQPGPVDEAALRERMGEMIAQWLYEQRFPEYDSWEKDVDELVGRLLAAARPALNDAAYWTWATVLLGEAASIIGYVATAKDNSDLSRNWPSIQAAAKEWQEQYAVGAPGEPSDAMIRAAWKEPDRSVRPVGEDHSQLREAIVNTITDLLIIHTADEWDGWEQDLNAAAEDVLALLHKHGVPMGEDHPQRGGIEPSDAAVEAYADASGMSQQERLVWNPEIRAGLTAAYRAEREVDDE